MKRFARRLQAAFTLIESVVVMVLIGILAAVALPRYFRYTDEARTKALEAAARAISAAATSNYALRKAGSGVAVTSCTGAAALASINSDMVVSANGTAPSAGVPGQCKINYGGSSAVPVAVTFTATGA